MFLAAMLPRRSDLLSHWLARGIITRVEYQAGRQFERLYETAGLDAQHATLDTRRERVDGGRSSCTVERTIAAREQLLALKPLLGETDWGLLSRVVGRGDDLATAKPDERRYLMRRIRESLSTIGQRIVVHVGTDDVSFETLRR